MTTSSVQQFIFAGQSPSLSSGVAGRSLLVVYGTTIVVGGVRGLLGGVGEYIRGWNKRPRKSIRNRQLKHFEGIYNTAAESLTFVRDVFGGALASAGTVAAAPIVVPWIWLSGQSDEA